MDNWDFVGGVEYLQCFFIQCGLIVFGDLNQKQYDNIYSVFVEINGQLIELLIVILSV